MRRMILTSWSADPQTFVQAPVDRKHAIGASMTTHVDFVRFSVGRPVVDTHQEIELVYYLQESRKDNARFKI